MNIFVSANLALRKHIFLKFQMLSFITKLHYKSTLENYLEGSFILHYVTVMYDRIRKLNFGSNIIVKMNCGFEIKSTCRKICITDSL